MEAAAAQREARCSSSTHSGGAQAYIEEAVAAFNAASMSSAQASLGLVQQPHQQELPLTGPGSTASSSVLSMQLVAPSGMGEAATAAAAAAAAPPAGPSDGASVLPGATSGPAAAELAALAAAGTAQQAAQQQAVHLQQQLQQQQQQQYEQQASAAADTDAAPVGLSSETLAAINATAAAAAAQAAPMLPAAAVAVPAPAAVLLPPVAVAPGMSPPGMSDGACAAAAANAAGLNAPLLMAAGLSTATALMPTGATPAQLAGGMPALQAVPVIVTSQQPGASLAQPLSTQPFAASSQPFLGHAGLDGTSLTASTLAAVSADFGSTASCTSTLGSTFGAAPSAAALLGSTNVISSSAPAAAAAASAGTPASDLCGTLTKLAVAQQQHQQAAQQVQHEQAAVAALVSSGADVSSATVGNSLTKLAMAQQHQQQAAATAATLQAAAAAAAAAAVPQAPLVPSIVTPAPSLASNLSNLSLSNLRSASVASSVMSGLPTSSSLEPIRSIAGSSASTTASGSKKVRVLLSSGGEYEELEPTSGGSGSRSARWRYVGGETRLVGLHVTSSYSDFLQQLSKATSAVWEESCRLMYDLPSNTADGGGLLVDLIDDEDLEMMYEELEAAQAAKPGYRLHLYVQLGCKRASGGAADSSIVSEERMSGSGLNSAAVSTPKDSATSTAIDAATAAAAATPPESHHNSAVTGGGATPRHAAANGDGQGSSSGSAHTPRTAGGSSAAAAGGGGGGSSGTTAGFGSSEMGELLDDWVVSSSDDHGQLVDLQELEAKMEIIKPEDLQPVRLLGSGGFGEVYLCRWHSCEVAVKCLNPNLLVPDGAMGSYSKDNVQELLKEASILGNLRHPCVVWVYGLVMPPLDPALEAVRSALGPGQAIDAVKVATQMANRHRNESPASAIRPPALVTEYLASGSLRSAIARRADFISKDSVRIKLALDAARGMEYLHAKNVVHFDIKTANLLIGMRDKSPICKVADFGLSKQKQQTFVTGVASLRGTLPWIAPEVIKTPGSVTKAVDVFSFGVVLWELWTLREPFDNVNPHALLHLMSTSTETVRPAMPGTPEFEGEAVIEPAPGWADVVNECLATNPEDRPTFRQLVERLELMLRQNRLAKKRSASSPAVPGGGADAPAASLG